MKQYNLEILYETAITGACEDESIEGLLFGIEETILNEFQKGNNQIWEYLNKLNIVYKAEWDREYDDEKTLKKVIKNLGIEKALKIFFQLGRIQGIKEAYRVL